MSSKVGSWTNTDPKSSDDFQIFDNRFYQLTSDVSKVEAYYLPEITRQSNGITSEELCLNWLKTEFPQLYWRKNSELFKSISNQSGYCELLVRKCQRPHILLFTDELESECALIIEIISNENPKLSFFHLVASLTDMCRVFDQSYITGYLFPSIRCRHPVVQVTVKFTGFVYQAAQRVLVLDDVPGQVYDSCCEALSKNLKCCNDIGVIPRSFLDKHTLVKSILGTLDRSGPFLSKDSLLSSLRDCEKNPNLVAFLSSGWNIVLSVAGSFVIKIPARNLDFLRLDLAASRLKLNCISTLDYSPYVVQPLWSGNVPILGSTNVINIAMFEFLNNDDITAGNVCEYILGLLKSVQYIHGIGIAHTDIRMANVRFVIHENCHCARLIDFDRCALDVRKFSDDWEDVRVLIIVMLIRALQSRLKVLGNDSNRKVVLDCCIEALERSREVEGNKRPLLEGSAPNKIVEILEDEGMMLLWEGVSIDTSSRNVSLEQFVELYFGGMISRIRNFLAGLDEI